MSRIFAISARSADGIDRTRAGLADFLRTAAGIKPADVATTLASGRQAFNWRAAWLAEDRASLLIALQERPPLSCVRVPAGERSAAVVFSCAAGPRGTLARRWAERSPEVRRWLGRAAAELDAAGTEALLGALDDPESPWHAAAQIAVQYGFYRQLVIGGWTPQVIMAEDDAARPLVALAAGSIGLAQALTGQPDRARCPWLAVPGAAGTAPEAPSADDQRPRWLRDASLIVRATRAGTLAPQAETVLDAEGEGDLLTLIARLWCHGAAMDLTLGQPGKRIHLPGSSLERVAPAVELPPGMESARPLTSFEQRLLFQDFVRASSSAEHNVVAAAHLTPPLDLALLDEAWREEQEERPSLRTVYLRVSDRWLACVRREPLSSCDAVAETDHGKAFHQALTQEFELTERPLHRLVVADGATAQLLVLAAHQVAASRDTLAGLLDDLIARCRLRLPRNGTDLAAAPFIATASQAAGPAISETVSATGTHHATSE
jgi:hypothetical protein